MAREIIVREDQTGKQLERFLAKMFPIGYVRKLFRKKAVRLNGGRAKAHASVYAGDRIELFIPFESEESGHAGRPRGDPPAIEILFENAELLVVNKPAGLLVHEAKAVARNRTLLGLIEARYRDVPCKPRLVHRLDKETSGVLVAAKNEDVAQEFRDYFEQGKIAKEYLCLVAGRLPQNIGTIDFPLPGREGKTVPAITHYRVEKRFFDTTLARVAIETGRMHQIRLHFAKLGYPVVLDGQHGDFGFNKSFRKRSGLKRQFLHAARLSLTHRGKRFSWSAPPPDDLQQTLRALADERVQPSKLRGSGPNPKH